MSVFRFIPFIKRNGKRQEQAAVENHGDSPGKPATRPRELLEQIIAAENLDEVSELLDTIEDQRLLASVALHASSHEVVMAAAGKLSDHEMILKVLRNSSDKTCCHLLVNRPLPVSMLEKIKNSAALITVRKIAAEKIASPEAATVQDQARVPAWKPMLDEFDRICSEAERLQPVPESLSAFAALESSWKQINPAPPNYMEVLEKRLLKAKNRLTNAIKEQQRMHEEQQARIAGLEQLLREAVALAASENPARAEKQLHDLREKWSHLARHAGNISAMEKDFLAAAGQMENTIAEAAAGRQAELDRLKTLRDELAAIVDSDDFRKMADRVREIRHDSEENNNDDHETGELRRDLRQLCHRYFVRLKDSFAAQEYERCANAVIKQDICVKAESLLEIQDMHMVSTQLKELHAAWKNTGPAHREQESELWTRFRNACDELHRRCDVFFEEQRQQRLDNLQKKTDLLEEARKLQDSGEWRDAAERLKELQREWKNIGPAPHGEENRLHEEFHRACDLFFARRKSHYQELETQWEANAQVKLKLIEESGKLGTMRYKEAIARIKELRLEWKNTGKAEHNTERRLWEEFDSGINNYFATLEEQRPENLRIKTELCGESENFIAEIENLPNIHFGEMSRKAEELLQRWKECGPAPQELEQSLWERFDAPLKRFYEMRAQHHRDVEEQRHAAMNEKQALINELEDLIRRDGDWAGDTGLVKELQQRWKNTGSTWHDKEEELWHIFQSLCNDFFQQRRDFFEELNTRKELNMRKKLELCVRMEQLAGISSPVRNDSSLADELRIALQGGGIESPGSAHAAEQARNICDEWQSTGSAGKDEEQLYPRFKRARDSFFNAR